MQGVADGEVGGSASAGGRRLTPPLAGPHPSQPSSPSGVSRARWDRRLIQRASLDWTRSKGLGPLTPTVIRRTQQTAHFAHHARCAPGITERCSFADVDELPTLAARHVVPEPSGSHTHVILIVPMKTACERGCSALNTDSLSNGPTMRHRFITSSFGKQARNAC